MKQAWAELSQAQIKLVVNENEFEVRSSSRS